ncbi:hypothetical protein FVR03_01335 [Pontibacter qinzhouensis]|uniref:Uncharacterized protein n=1 Tax=Pontibacter qinzhouensis TaxID=2603253 RepID=A0A5C8KCP9_9BACT|nr:hypothetical protein [Pontibacter qinzhouensis]TXK52387.1 hypothetical protein FVR03_01335 [Pontibacter qinzhouensis]
MVLQYPHKLRFYTPGTDSTKNANGHLIPGLPGNMVEQPCRYEDTRETSEFEGVDNQMHQQRGTIYMPLGSIVPAPGTPVEITNVFKGIVHSRPAGQLNISLKV